ncbi:MAG: MFS transporter [Saprospiraceae bacterium]|nr:MFS transporter [Saprospiraceae bacterium]
METNAAAGSLYTKPFILLCLSHALFAGSFNMIIPELPAYLTSLGGAEHKGWIIALFTITAGISRPFSGKLTDTIGRIPVMYVGTFACVVCSMLYPALAFLGGFFALRFFHGFSTGFKPTGTSAYVADVVKPEHRGEAMGVLGITFSVGASAAPFFGSWLTKAWGLNWMFYASAFFALISMAILWNMPETLKKKQKFTVSHLKVGRQDIFDPLVIPSAITMILCYVSYGVILTLMPDMSDHLGLENRGICFSIFTIASVSTRFFAGRVSDQLGRVPVLRASALVIAFAMAAFALADSAFMLYFAAVLFGLGNGIFSPAINAWSVDLGDQQRKGRALATMYISLEIAIGGGALLAGWYFANDFQKIPHVFWWAAFMSLLGWLYLTLNKQKLLKHQNT